MVYFLYSDILKTTVLGKDEEKGKYNIREKKRKNILATWYRMINTIGKYALKCTDILRQGPNMPWNAEYVG